jgi:uncharacterized membrane protein YfcA
MSTLLFFVIAFLAAVVASVTGFGSATVLIPFASLVLDLKQAIVLVAFFHLFSNAFKLLSLRRSVDRRLLLVYGLPSIVLAVLGAWLFGALEVGALAVGFAAFIIAFAIYSLLKPSWKLPDRNSVLIFGGALSGFTAGLIGLGGAIRSMFLVSTRIEKEVYVATAAAIAVVVDISRIAVYVASGSLEAGNYWYIVPLIAVAFIGTRLGLRLLKRLPGSLVKRAVLGLLILVGLKMLLEQAGVF